MQNLRLTLRTLLSYLDDTLDPAHTKLIGQKVAESEQARDLIERIKQVTRRRRLTAPTASGPGGIDPNTMAEYLDNEVTAEQAAEVEQICLASDVHLAEVAACHQILTLVLGEPATVPPTARQRMYGLVKGPEAIPFRKPPRAAHAENSDLSSTDLGHDADETLRLGLPFVRRGGDWRSSLLLIGGGFAAACLLMLALYLTFLGAGTDEVPERPEAVAVVKDVQPPVVVEAKPVPPEKAEPVEAKKVEPAETKKADVETKKVESPVEVKVVGKQEPTPPAEVPFGPPDGRSAVVGQYVAGKTKEPVLLAQYDGKADWKRVGPKDPDVTSNQPLVGFPFSRDDVLTKGGVKLTLLGNAPEIWGNSLVHESRAIMHPSEQLALDLTLQRGRIALRNTKDEPAVARVRFENPTTGKQEHFDVTLRGRDAEALVEHVAQYPRTEPFYEDPKATNRVGPTVQVEMIAADGTVSFKIGGVEQTVNADALGPSKFVWSSARGISEAPASRPAWAEPGLPPLPKELDAKSRQVAEKFLAAARKSRDALADGLRDKPATVALAELVESGDPLNRRLAMRGYGAIDDLPSLVDALERENLPDLRLSAIDTLRYWIAQDRDHDTKLYDLLREKYRGVVSRKIMELLHSISEEDANRPSTYEKLIDDLDNPVLPLRELSYYHLFYLAPAGQSIPYSASADAKTRQRAQAQWRQLIPRGQLPPSARAKDKKS